MGARAGAIVRFDTVTVIMIADGIRYWTISYENHGPSRDHMARTAHMSTLFDCSWLGMQSTHHVHVVCTCGALVFPHAQPVPSAQNAHLQTNTF